MTTSTEHPLRKVAILVASLDADFADQVLESLPAATARQVQQLVEELSDVDPAEQAAIVADFRESLATPSRDKQSSQLAEDAVIFESSSDDRFTARDHYHPFTHEAPQPFQSLSGADTNLIASMLLQEHPQTIALVLSKLDATRAAEVLCRLPDQEQADIMARLGDLDAIDEQTVKVVEAQVAQWLAYEHQRVRRLTAGRELVDRILAQTSPQVRARLQAQVAGGADQDTQPLPSEAKRYQPPAITRVFHTRLPRTALQANAPQIAAQPQAPEVPPAPPTSDAPRRSQPTAEANPFANYSAEQCALALERIAPRVLQSALAECQPQVVTLALVGASPQLLKRALKGVSRSAARRFRQSLRDVGPVRLSDMLQAQQQLLNTVRRIMG